MVLNRYRERRSLGACETRQVMEGGSGQLGTEGLVPYLATEEEDGDRREG
jgi:hypothetical protein